MKFCPKCGTKVSDKETFCPKCGTPLKSKNTSTTKPKTLTRGQIKKVATSNSGKTKKVAFGIGIAAILLAVGGTVFFTIKSQNNQPAQTESASSKSSSDTEKADAKNADKIVYKKFNKHNKKQRAGLVIAYAGLKYKKNSLWQDAYRQLKSGNTEVKKYQAYDFGDYHVQAPKGGAVYVVSPHTGYAVTKSQKTITYITDQGDKDVVSSDTVNKQVRDNISNKKFKQLVKNLSIITQESNEKSSSADFEALWDSDKNQKLADFMDDFGNKMDQNYSAYDGEEPLKTAAGQTYPDIFKDYDFMLNDEKINIGWNPDVTKNSDKYDYNVVAIFNYDKEDSDTADHITYLFCFYHNKPIVLVDQTTNGDEVRVEETENSDLRDGFEKIANQTGNSEDDE